MQKLLLVLTTSIRRYAWVKYSELSVSLGAKSEKRGRKLRDQRLKHQKDSNGLPVPSIKGMILSSPPILLSCKISAGIPIWGIE